MLRTLLSSVAVAAALAAASGCSGGDDEASSATQIETATASQRATATPTPVATTTPTPARTETYVVVAGDTLAKIAERFGVELAEIVELNALTNPSLIEVGQSLILPSADEPEVALSDCEAAFRDAAAIPSTQDTVEDLDPAVRQCASLAQWVRAAQKYPNAIDGADPEAFARTRCGLSSILSNTALCRDLSGPLTRSAATARIVECLSALPATQLRSLDIEQLQRGVSAIQMQSGGWIIERADPAKLDLPDFPAWEVSPSGRVVAITDAAAELTSTGGDLLC